MSASASALESALTGAPTGAVSKAGERLSAIATLLDYANDLKRLPRAGWLLAGVTPAESVAEHSFATTLLALQLAQTVNAEFGAQGLDRPLDVERVVRIALVHDLAESVVTDLPKRSSQALGEENKRRSEETAWQSIEPAPELTGSLHEYWAEYAAGESNEARLVKDADKLEMLHQALRYATGGNRNLAEFWAQRAWAYPASGELRHLLLVRFGIAE